jgi:hypothetical protein
MDHRVKPGGDDEKNGDLVIASGSEAIQSEAPLWIASSLTLLAMTTWRIARNNDACLMRRLSPTGSARNRPNR